MMRKVIDLGSSTWPFFPFFLASLYHHMFSLGHPEVGTASREPTHKVIAAKNLLPENGYEITLWHDYGSFALYRVTHEAWLKIPAHIRLQVQLADDMNQLFIGENTIDTQQKGLQQDEANDVYTGKSLYLIQFAGPIKDEWLTAVEATGTKLVHYIANNGYLVWTDAGCRRKSNILAEQDTFLQFSTPYLSSFKLGPTLGVEHAVAGFASLAYAFLQQQYDLTAPSPALLKAFIIAHTMYLNGSGSGGNLPSDDQGYGLPDMSAAGKYSLPRMFSSKQLPGECPIGVTPEVLYSTDFEGSVSDWTHDGINDKCQLSDVRSHSANISFHAEGRDEVSDQKLISPNINLPADHGFLSLQYWNYQALESNQDEEFGCFDGSILEISTNGSQSWQQIGDSPNDDTTLITDPYHGIIESAHDNPLSGQSAWCGDPQDWSNSVVRTDNFAGQTVRFRLGSDASLGDES